MSTRGLMALAALVVCRSLAGAEAPRLSLPDILTQMAEHDSARNVSLSRYVCVRNYTLHNVRFNKRAAMTVRMTYEAPGVKSFEVLSQGGPSIIRERVLRKMFEAEAEASSNDLRPFTQITPGNYDFELAGADVRDGRPCYVLNLIPKRKNKFMMNGRIWVDGEDFAIVRVEAVPAQNPSVLIRDTTVTQQYAKKGSLWLPALNHSETNSMWFGKTEVEVRSSEYQISNRLAASGAASSGASK